MQDAENINKRSAVIALTWPIFIEMFLQMLINNVDQVMVGWYSPDASGAVSNANQLMNFLIVLFEVVSTASTILVSQYIGSGNREKADEIYSLALFINFLLSVLVSAGLFFGSRTIFTWMNVPPKLMEDSCRYISVIGSFMFLPALYFAFSSFLRSNAMTKVTMLVSFIINVCNIGGNYLLIYGNLGFPALGVQGAAISSTVSRLIGLITIAVLFRKFVGVRLSFRQLRPFPREHLRRILRIGVPSAGENMSYNFSQVCIQSICNLFAIYAINTRVYINVLASCGYLFALSVSMAAQIVVGYLMGARKIPETHRRVMATLKMGACVSFAMAVLAWLFAEPLLRLFSSDPQVIALGRQILTVELLLEISRAINMTLVFALQAAGDVRFPIYLSVVVVWSVAVAGGYLLGVTAGLGLLGVWIAMAADETIRAVVLLIRWKGGKWQTKNLIA